MTPKPPPETLDLVEVDWPADQPIYRFHSPIYPGNSFNPTDAAYRFSPVYRGGKVVPVSYCGASFDCGLAETVFHDVPLTGVRAVSLAEVAARFYSVLRPARSLRLAELHGFGLRRLGLVQGDIIDFGSEGYAVSREWGQAIYDWRDESGEDLDGIVWMSRQFNSERALMLFGSLRGAARVKTSDLRLDPDESNIPLDDPATLERVHAAASRAGIAILSPG